MIIKSPLTGSSNIKLIQTIDTEFIIKGYKKTYNIDISTILNGVKIIEQYQCLDTGYIFFHPFSLSGDSKFYEQLQNYDWYYMDWKWENNIALNFIKSTDRVLEIGSGKGIFLEKLQNINAQVLGLEINEDSVKKSISKGLSVFNESIQEHSGRNKEAYNVVCSFQVMEHIAEIGDVLKASIESLKKGGKLIISVPNNGGYLLRNKIGLLNLPPHHMGLWNLQSLKSLEKLYPIVLTNIEIEPLQKYHYDWLYSEILSDIGRHSNRIKRFIDFTFRHYYKNIFDLLATNITGHSILVVYEKK